MPKKRGIEHKQGYRIDGEWGRDTSARSRDLYFVKEDEDGGEMREVTYGERGSARTITVQVEIETDTHRKV
jgi:hypothetical protein